jgi:tetratricopeptide (TPR) repeat protein
LFALALASAGASERPASIDDVVSSSLDHLDADLVEFARAIAVLDAAHDLDLMAGIVRRPPTELLALLERLVDADLLIERGSGFAFRHPLVRDVLSRTTGTARSALLHREAAQWLVNRPDSDPLAIALHARLGGANDLAADALVRAATISLERADLAAAEQQLRASVEARPSAEARAALARVLMVAQRLDEAAAEAEMAIALGGGPSAFEVAGWIEYYRRRYDRAERLADEASARAERTSPVRASALALAGRIRHGHGHLADAEERLAIAIGGPPEIKALAEVWLGQVRIHQGRPEDALEVVEHALLDPEHIAHPYAALHGRFCRVVAFGQLGEAAAALRACDELRAAIEHAGSRGVRFRAIELNVRSWVLRGIGRPDEAETLSLEAIDLNGAADGSGPHSQGFAEAYWVGFLDLADGYLAAGRVDDAARVERLLAALDHWDGTMAWHQRHRLGLIRARIARASGDTDRAAELAATVMTDSAGRGCDRYAALAHVQLALAGGDGDRERIDRSVDVLRRCAGFELPGLLDQLADTCRVDAWAAEATHRRVALTARL